MEVGKYLIRSIRALFDCVPPFLMCKTRQVQVEQTQNNLEINCMLDVKMNTYLEMPKKICTPPPPKKKTQQNKERTPSTNKKTHQISQTLKTFSKKLKQEFRPPESCVSNCLLLALYRKSLPQPHIQLHKSKCN